MSLHGQGLHWVLDSSACRTCALEATGRVSPATQSSCYIPYLLAHDHIGSCKHERRKFGAVKERLLAAFPMMCTVLSLNK